MTYGTQVDESFEPTGITQGGYQNEYEEGNFRMGKTSRQQISDLVFAAWPKT